MEEDGDGEELTPFWLQSTADLRHTGRLRRGISSLFLTSGMVVVILMVTAVVSLVFVLPSTLSFTSRILKPNSVEKSWDSLNMLLVFIAVVFGFLSRNRNEETDSVDYNELHDSSTKRIETQKSIPINLQQSIIASTSKWFKEDSDYQQKNQVLRRNSTSYPDLKEFAAHSEYGDYHHQKVYDDVYMDPGQRSDPGRQRHRRHRSLGEIYHPTEETETEVDIVDALGSKSNLGMPLSEGPLPEVEELENKPENERLRRKKERLRGKGDKDLENWNYSSAPRQFSDRITPPEHKTGKIERTRGSVATIATKDFFNSMYPNRKRKKHRQRSVGNLDSLLHEAALSFQTPQQSPPPPPPSPSVLHNKFQSKGQKENRTITVMLAPPNPALPTPQPSRHQPAAQMVEPETISLSVPSTTHKPTFSLQTSTFDRGEHNSISGGESPLNRIPPPPSLPKNPVWKFVVQGDYVRVNSPKLGETESDVTPSSANGGSHSTPFQPSPLFCPSPDVNTKAESFITNFRAKLKLEKIHSMKKHETGLPGTGPNGTRM